jgi:hypothetical protein
MSRMVHTETSVEEVPRLRWDYVFLGEAHVFHYRSAFALGFQQLHDTMALCWISSSLKPLLGYLWMKCCNPVLNDSNNLCVPCWFLFNYASFSWVLFFINFFKVHIPQDVSDHFVVWVRIRYITKKIKFWPELWTWLNDLLYKSPNIFPMIW